MPKDFAKKHLNAKRPEEGLRRGNLFLAGFLLGFFICFLGALWYFIPIKSTPPIKEVRPLAQPKEDTDTDEMQWDFYEIFPKSVVPVVEEYNKIGEKVTADQFSWILQAGSFLEIADADKMRGELILIGLEAFITAVEVSGREHHRVIVGPFDTELDRNRAQDKLAQAQISSVAIKIPK